MGTCFGDRVNVFVSANEQDGHTIGRNAFQFILRQLGFGQHRKKILRRWIIDAVIDAEPFFVDEVSAQIGRDG